MAVLEVEVMLLLLLLLLLLLVVAVVVVVVVVMVCGAGTLLSLCGGDESLGIAVCKAAISSCNGKGRMLSQSKQSTRKECDENNSD